MPVTQALGVCGQDLQLDTGALTRGQSLVTDELPEMFGEFPSLSADRQPRDEQPHRSRPRCIVTACLKRDLSHPDQIYSRRPMGKIDLGKFQLKVERSKTASEKFRSQTVRLTITINRV